MRSGLAIVFALLAVILAPAVQAVPSGLTYLDSTWSSIEGDGGELIAMNPNGTILASYHGKTIILFNTTTLNKIGEFSFDEDIAAMEFNPNGSMLAINKRSTVHLKESIRLIDIDNLEVLEYSVQADDSFRDISWSVDGNIIAAQGYDGDVEQYRVPSLSLKNTLHGVHVVDVTCIDYRSDGQYLVTGDESGRWAVWNLQGQRQGSYREFGQGLLDCKFTPDGMDLVFLGEDGNFTARVFGQSDKHSMEILGGKEVLFSQTGNRMHIAVENSGYIGLDTYDYENFNLIQNTSFFHRIEDIEFIEDDYSRIQSIFVAGGTGEIAVYLRELIPPGFNMPGVDLDGDLVPDDLDPDDDGDGVIDDWDDDFGCDAPDGTPCSRYPDLNKIRNIEVYVGNEFIVRDQITLPTEDSSNIRNLSRNAIAMDQVVSSTETNLFAKAICDNMDHGDIIEQLKDSIILSSGELGDAIVECEVTSGMELVRDGDSTTQITILITTTFTYNTEVTLPLDITLERQTLPTDGSIAWLAPAHPISLSFKGENVETKVIPLWWNDGEDEASITIDQISVKNPTLVENIIDYAFHPLAFILYLGIIVGIVTLVIRQRNQIDFNIDDEVEEDVETDEEDSEEDTESFYEDVESTSQDWQDIDPSPTEVSSKKKIVKRPPRKSTAAKKRVIEKSSDTDVVVKKKRVSGGSLNKEGPITKTKRKRLISSPESKVDLTEEIVEETSLKVKTRRVKAKKEDNSPDVKKTRKPVKRKSKPKVEKIIDEKQLQDSLVDDFTNSE